MENITKNENIYTLTTEKGRANLRSFCDMYNKNTDNDILFKKIGIEEGLALCNIEEFIKNKSQVAEVVREAIEIGLNATNFKTNTIFTFARNKLKKAGYNSIIRVQIENYIKFRLHLCDKVLNTTEKQVQFDHVQKLTLNNITYYYDPINDRDLTENEIKEFLNYKSNLIGE